VKIQSVGDFEQVLADYVVWRRQFCDDKGVLLPKFEPLPLTASFLPGFPTL
jgi:hypothetical protein